MMNQLLLLGSWWGNIFKNLTFLLDKGVYSLVQSAYAVFYYLAEARLLDDAIVRNITNRVYTLLSIIMVFVLAFNLLNYIVDPDKINDKKIGASAFVKDVIISLAVIALTPLLFNKLYALQGQILSSGAIANLILGGQSSANAQYDTNKYNSLTDFYIQNGANTMVASVYVAFLYPADGFTALDCHSDTADPDKLAKHQAYCDAYDKAGEGGGINAFSDFITNDEYNYTPLLTTVAGIVLLFFMLSFCVNLAKRVGKLAVLQFLAPIPMALELIPNKKGLRKNWFDTLIKVYLEAFFFLAVMYIIIFLISLVPSVVTKIFEAGEEGLSLTKLITVIFLMYGLLIFGKEAPQMVFDLLGIKSTGVIGEAAKRAISMGAVTANTAAATAGNFIRGATENQGIGRIGGAILGAGSAAARNLWAGRNVHSLRDATNNRRQINQGIATRRVNRQAYNFEHGGFWGGVGGHISDGLGGINRGFKGATSIALGYQRKKEQEMAFKGLKDKAKSGIMDIINNDSTYQVLRDRYLRGDRRAAIAMRDRVKELMKNNASKIRVGVGEMNGYMGSHLNVEGMSDKQIDFNSLLNAKGEVDASKIFKLDKSGNIEIRSDGTVGFGGDIKDAIDGKDVTMRITDSSGVSHPASGKVSDLLGKDYGYQNQKANETINERVREEAHKAVQQKQEEQKKK